MRKARRRDSPSPRRGEGRGEGRCRARRAPACAPEPPGLVSPGPAAGASPPRHACHLRPDSRDRRRGSRALYVGDHPVGGDELALFLQRGQHEQPLRLRGRLFHPPADRAGPRPDPPLHPQPGRHRHLAAGAPARRLLSAGASFRICCSSSADDPPDRRQGDRRRCARARRGSRRRAGGKRGISPGLATVLVGRRPGEPDLRPQQDPHVRGGRDPLDRARAGRRYFGRRAARPGRAGSTPTRRSTASWSSCRCLRASMRPGRSRPSTRSRTSTGSTRPTRAGCPPGWRRWCRARRRAA